jgi:DNA-directed RNA polymerase alpha subunit
MEVIVKNPEKLIFRTDINYTILNSLRRSVEEVQTLAIDDVEIFKNDSALYDEVFAHRLGLIPLRTESKMNSKTSVELTLKKTGPCTVYSGDFKGDVTIPFKEIPITILGNGQEIEVVATANMNNGISHAKHVPGLMYYRNLFEVKTGNVKIDSIVQKQTGEIAPEKRGSKWICDLSDAQVDEISSLDSEAINDSKDQLVFIESFGLMDAEKIFVKSAEQFQKNLEMFEASLK